MLGIDGGGSLSIILGIIIGICGIAACIGGLVWVKKHQTAATNIYGNDSDDGGDRYQRIVD